MIEGCHFIWLYVASLEYVLFLKLPCATHAMICPDRAREGFWVDVEAGKPPPAMEANIISGKYGTFADHPGHGDGAYLYWVVGVGGGIMLLLIVHILFLHFHYVKGQ